MDLIREELLRQQKALELLLLGTGPQAELASLPEEIGRTSPAAEESGGVQAMADTGDSSSAGAWSSQGNRASQGSWESGPLMTAGGSIREAAGGLSEVNFGTTAPLNAAQTALPGAAAAGADLEEDRLVTEYVLAGRSPGTGARELSRLFERDARRYDGGFPS